MAGTGQAMDIREYRVGFRQQAMSREEAQSSMFKMLQEAWEKNNGFDDDEWGETQSPPFILKRATDKKAGASSHALPRQGSHLFYAQIAICLHLTFTDARTRAALLVSVP